MKTKSNIKIGEVVSIDDPTFSGRIKVRVSGLNDGIPVEKLPWVTFAGSGMFSANGGGSISIPRVGSKVRIDFKEDDVNSMEWRATNMIDRDLANEIASDYAGSQVLLFDSEYDLSIKFQPNSGLVLYYKGSNIQITPDNNILIHQGGPGSGTDIQLSDGQINIIGAESVNVNAGSKINVEANSITLNGSDTVQIKGDNPGECAVNGKALITLLQTLANQIDLKTPQSGGIATMLVNAAKEGILNENIQYI